MSLIQIPFSGFKAIKLFHNVGLDLYQALFDDHTEPVGMIAAIQAFGLLKPADAAIELWSERWNKSTARWKLKNSGIEFATGKSTVTAEMNKTADGEVTLMMLSFLLDSLELNSVYEISKAIIDTTPETLVQIKPRRVQIISLLEAVRSQVSGVSWSDQIEDAEKVVGDIQLGVRPAERYSAYSSMRDIPTHAMSLYYQALCTVTRFPDYSCTLETSSSLVLPYALARLFCGLRVCVVVDGEVTHGHDCAERWQVRLERVSGNLGTRVKLGRRIDQIQDVLIIGEPGFIRANKIPLKGIGKAWTIGQGLSILEAEELAVCAVCIAARALRIMKRDLIDYGKPDRDLVAPYTNFNHPEDGPIDLVPVQTRLGIAVLVLWWDCSESHARSLYDQATEHPMFCGNPKGWEKIGFGNQAIGRIARHETCGKQGQVDSSSIGPRTRFDYTELLRDLASQLVLISFLEFNDISQHQIRVRNSCRASMTPLGRAIRGTLPPSFLRPSDVLASWYYWLEHRLPPDDHPECLSADGFLIYRSLLLDMSLDPRACEMVIVQPGYILYENSRFDSIQGSAQNVTVIGHPPYRKSRTESFVLRSTDETGQVDLSWNVWEKDRVLIVSFNLGIGSSVSIQASVGDIIARSWNLLCDCRVLNCSYESDTMHLVKGEKIEELTPGKYEALRSPMELFKSFGNNLGQVACLLSTKKRGMVKRDACLRCCLSYAQEKRLDFLID